MSYTVLSRKWRPKAFEDVIGQDHITKILINSISQDKVSHAYLFSGPRGVGKTTIARILACVLNKVEKVENSIDIIELDGASNRGIDEIREIKESVRYAPSEGKYKIFIIDESHMLTKEAFNALLKTLEEPPPNVLFILATTEYNKLPLTIISRCQRYSFKRISLNSIKDYLKIILSKEGLDFEDSALTSISYKADGSMRDALSLLDKVITICENNIITESVVKNALGIIDEHEYLKILESILDSNFEAVFNSIEKVLSDGVSILNFIDGFNIYLKNIIYYLSNYRKNISISKNTVIFLKKTHFDLQVASKLLNVNLEYLIKNNHNLSNISLENHFIKVFSFLNRYNKNTSSTNQATKIDNQKINNISVEKKSVNKDKVDSNDNKSKKNESHNDKDADNQSSNEGGVDASSNIKDADNQSSNEGGVDASSNIKDADNQSSNEEGLPSTSNIKKAYDLLIRHFEKNDYKLYCVLSKCAISSYSPQLIKIASKELSSYEQNSINMELNKINDKLNDIIEIEFSNKTKVRVAFDEAVQAERKSEDLNTKIEINSNQSIRNENKEEVEEDEDHPLFDSIIDDLEGKLLK